jgi:hypothetical protein
MLAHMCRNGTFKYKTVTKSALFDGSGSDYDFVMFPL